MLNKFPLPEDPKAMISHFEELKKTILDDIKAQPEYKDQAEFSIACIDNLVEALQAFDKADQSDLNRYVAVIAHLELFNSIFAAGDEEEDEDFFFDLEEEELEEEGHNHKHGGSCCDHKSPCDDKKNSKN